MIQSQPDAAPTWMRFTLRLAATYNLLGSIWVSLFPSQLVGLLGAHSSWSSHTWQLVAVFVGFLGLGYLVASFNPFRSWPIVSAGFLGTFLGPIVFALSALNEPLPWGWGLALMASHLAWSVPFGLMLHATWRESYRHGLDPSRPSLRRLLESRVTHRGATLMDLSQSRPTLVIFLRHSGCTFCRETLSDLAKYRRRIESAGVEIAVVHMGTPLSGTQMCEGYGVSDLHRISDPGCELYHAFGLGRATLAQLLGPQVLVRSLKACIVDGHGLGSPDGDTLQMSGTFLVSRGRIIASHPSKSVADRVDYPVILARARDLPGSNLHSARERLRIRGSLMAGV